ncbi:MAG TPA: hypothetical protein VJN02_08510 [Gammaproteobacteria bacterium]|nr:hypothetical protein [Gammaproteobacteria bacterium]
MPTSEELKNAAEILNDAIMSQKKLLFDLDAILQAESFKKILAGPKTAIQDFERKYALLLTVYQETPNQPHMLKEDFDKKIRSLKPDNPLKNATYTQYLEQSKKFPEAFNQLIYDLIKMISDLKFSGIQDSRIHKMCEQFYVNCSNHLDKNSLDNLAAQHNSLQDNVGKYILINQLKKIAVTFQNERGPRLTGMRLRGIFAPPQSEGLRCLLEAQQKLIFNLSPKAPSDCINDPASAIKCFVKEIADLKIKNSSHTHFCKMCDDYIKTCLSKLSPNELTVFKENLESGIKNQDRGSRQSYQTILKQIHHIQSASQNTSTMNRNH